MTQAMHASADDIRAILEARRKVVFNAAPSVNNIPVLPPPHVVGAEAVVAKASALATPATTPPIQVTAPTPTVDDATLSEFLQDHLPELTKATIALVTPPFEWSEVTKLGALVSDAVRIGLPMVHGVEGRALVVVISRYLWRTFAVGLLPPFIRPFAGLLEGFILSGIESAYKIATHSN